MTNTLYTVVNSTSGEPEGRHLTAAEAAAIILNHDSADFEIREGQECDGILTGERFYDLWTRKQVANKPWTKTVGSVIAGSREEAEVAIFAEVIAANWPRHPEAMTDEQYDRLSADDAE